MTGQQLKNSILQEAIQGRLVPNVLEPGEKPAAKLLLDAIAKRQKKGNKENNKVSAISLSTIEDGPWELPDCWCWCKFNDLFEVSGGSQPPKSFFVDTPRDGYVRLYQIRDYGSNPVPTYVPISMVNKFTSKGDILIARYGGSLGKIFWAEDGAYNVAMAKSISLYEGLSYTKYLYYFFHTQLFRDAIFGASSRSAQAGFNKEDLESLLFPFPPLSIQKAIVKKIEELFPLVDEYDKAAGELETLNKILPDKLRKSVLQEAIHGNLVSNDIPEEEATAPELLKQILKERQEKENKEKGKKAKKLTLSTIEEEPWELPEGWCWCLLGDVISLLSGRDLEPNKYNASHKGIPYITGASNFDSGSIIINRWTPSPVSVSKRGDLLITCKGTVGELAFNTIGDIHIARQIMAISTFLFNSRYLQIFLKAKVNDLNAQANGVIPGISRDDILLAKFPLPPLSIQHRIVEKIEEVFSSIDKLC